MDVIKKVAKHILLALETLHKFEIDGKKIIHSDIKPQNIAVCTLQRNIFNQLKEIVESRESLLSLRMACKKKFGLYKKSKFIEDDVRARLKKCVTNVPEEDELNGLTFKLIDFGSVKEEGKRQITGTYGFCPPEYYFGARLSYSHDIWALGITLVHLFTCQRFIPYGKDKQNKREMEELRNIFGKFPREVYINCNFPWKYKKRFTEKGLNLDDFEMQFKKVLQKKIESYQMYEQMSLDDRQELNEFLSNMVHFKPRRKTAEELLAHPSLKGVI